MWPEATAISSRNRLHVIPSIIPSNHPMLDLTYRSSRQQERVDFQQSRIYSCAMKTALAWGLLCAFGAARSISPAHVYFLDTGSEPSLSSESVKPTTARLILAQRLGLSSFYSLADSSPEEIQQINQLAWSPQLLFGRRRTTGSRSRVLILVDGVESTNGKCLR
jgi:hypothetical protein